MRAGNFMVTVDGRNPAPVDRFFPSIYKLFYISGGAGFQPSTVVNGLFHPYISRLDMSRKYVK